MARCLNLRRLKAFVDLPVIVKSIVAGEGGSDMPQLQHSLGVVDLGITRLQSLLISRNSAWRMSAMDSIKKTLREKHLLI